MTNFEYYKQKILEMYDRDSNYFEIAERLAPNIIRQVDSTTSEAYEKDYFVWGMSEHREPIKITRSESHFFAYLKADFNYILKTDSHVYVSKNKPENLHDDIFTFNGDYLELDTYFDYVDFDGLEMNLIYYIDDMLADAEEDDSTC